MAKLDLKKSIKGLTFLTKRLPYFGSRVDKGDQSVFDRRGAIVITDKELKKKNGEVINIRGVKDAGGSSASSIAITRPISDSYVDPAKAMDAYHSWPYAAIKPIADEIAGIEWRVYKTNKKGEREELQDHELIDFLEMVNTFQTGPEFKHTLAAHLELTGNAYIFLDGVSDELSKPTAMYLLDPGRVKVKINKTIFPFTLVGYEFTFDAKTWNFQPYQILHIKYPNPSNQFMGMGTVQGAAEWIDNDNAQTQFMREFFKNGAQIGVTFETDMTSEEQLHELKDSFNEQHTGVGNAYKAIFLPKGVKKPANDVKFDDIGFDETSEKNRDKILAAFRVPKTILGAAESDTNRATAETADYVFAKRTIKPKMILICSYLNEFLVPRFGDDIILSFTDPVTEDRVALSTEMKNAVGSAPVITANEAREEYMGMEPIEGGDTLLTPNTFVPINDAGKVNAYALAQPSPATDEKKFKRKAKAGYMPARMNRAKTQFAKNVEARKALTDHITEKITAALNITKKKDVMEMTNEEYDNVFLKARRERYTKIAEEMKAALIELNNKQKDEVIKNLDHALKEKDVNPDRLFDLDNWITLTINAIRPLALKLFEKEANVALELINEPGLDVENTPEAKRALDRAMKLMARSYNQDTVDILEAKINEGLKEGYGVQQMGQLITDIYEWKNTVAAERVALTESNRITNDAGKIAWKQSGVVTEIKWVTSARDNVCEFCAAMEGKTIAIEKNFFDKGDEIEGDDGGMMEASYSDVGAPPLHPNCHCGIRPVVSKKIELAVEEADEKEVDAALKTLEKFDEK